MCVVWSSLLLRHLSNHSCAINIQTDQTSLVLRVLQLSLFCYIFFISVLLYVPQFPNSPFFSLTASLSQFLCLFLSVTLFIVGSIPQKESAHKRDLSVMKYSNDIASFILNKYIQSCLCILLPPAGVFYLYCSLLLHYFVSALLTVFVFIIVSQYPSS